MTNDTTIPTEKIGDHLAVPVVVRNKEPIRVALVEPTTIKAVVEKIEVQVPPATPPASVPTLPPIFFKGAGVRFFALTLNPSNNSNIHGMPVEYVVDDVQGGWVKLRAATGPHGWFFPSSMSGLWQ